MDIDRLIPPTEVRQVCRELGLRDWTTLPDRYVFREEAEALLRALAPENTTITVEMFRSGLEEELRHGTFAGPNNSTNNHPLLTARLAAQIEAMTHDLRASVSGLVTTLNDMMLDGPQTDAYLTMVYARLDLARQRVRLVQAGHPHPVVQRADGSIEQIGNGGLPVGVVAGARYDELEVALAPGDRMLIVSDGITDAVGPRGEMLGSEGLRAILRLNAPLSGNALLESMSWSVSSFASGDRADDRSAVLIEHLPGAALLPHPGAGDAAPEGVT